MGATVTLASAGNQANPAGSAIGASNPLPVVNYSSSGTENTALPPGPAAASASVPTTEAAYNTVVAYSGATTVGRAVAIVCTVAGTATITLTSGSIVIPVSVGLTIIPFAATNAVQTTGTMTLYKLV